jgi:RNA polymerase sigma-70 factor (ECF subfamily)
MQFGGALVRTPRRSPELDVLASWISVLAGTAVLQVAGVGAGRDGLPVHLAAATKVATAYPSARTVGTADAAEVIDPEIVEHVKGAQEGNAHSFSILYDRYVDKVYAYCYHRVGNAQTAEDLTSDVFMRALKRIDTFSWQGKDFGAWLITIARNRCHDHFKSSRFRLENPVAEVYDSVDAGPSYDAQPERNLEVQDIRTQVHAGMAKLKSEQAEVLYHRFLQGFDVATTAEIMGKNEGAVRALQYRALKALSKHVDVEALL